MVDLSALFCRIRHPHRRRFELAATARVQAHHHLIERILIGAVAIPPEDVWVSDETSLADFCVEEGVTEERLRARIERMFEVDISGIEDGNLAEVAEHIAANSPRL